jgi:hypothetical protein
MVAAARQATEARHDIERLPGVRIGVPLLGKTGEQVTPET